jgi:hypothetical protein
MRRCKEEYLIINAKSLTTFISFISYTSYHSIGHFTPVYSGKQWYVVTFSGFEERVYLVNSGVGLQPNTLGRLASFILRNRILPTGSLTASLSLLYFANCSIAILCVEDDDKSCYNIHLFMP